VSLLLFSGMVEFAACLAIVVVRVVGDAANSGYGLIEYGSRRLKYYIA